jgi:high-affinity nickel-transport protein
MIGGVAPLGEAPGAQRPRGLFIAPLRDLLVRTPELRRRLIGVCALLAILNIGAWLLGILAFRAMAVPLALMLMVYGLGLRHAVDADHIAAIDNVTRKLMENQQRPVAVGFFFALGHSTVVILVTLAVAHAARMLGRFKTLQDLGGMISVSVSALFLFLIAVMNLFVFFSVYRSFRRLRAGQDPAALPSAGGVLSRVCRPLFGLVTRSWQMFPLGFLFGLGFDTATEVAVFSVSIAHAAQGLSLWVVLLFPLLFAAGMSLVDTADGIVMLGAYEWAFVKPLRKLYYNMTITLLSALIALVVGSIEALGLVSQRLELHGTLWRGVTTLNANFNNLGFIIIALVLVAWLLSYLYYRIRGGEQPLTGAASSSAVDLAT